MIRTVRYRVPIAAAALAGLFAILISGCGVPLAPGYKIQKETLAVHFVPGSPPHLTVRAEYRLANIGNAPLHFIGGELPGEKNFGRANLRAEVDGKEITLQHNLHEAADDWRVPLPAAWRQKEKLNLVLSYDLAAQSATDPRIFAAANAFYLNDSGWLPALMGFKAFLSPAIVRPNPTDLSVTVPNDFRITASGQLRGVKKQGSETQYNFRIRKGDFEPYVLAGQYNEQRISTSNGTVVIWTTKPISAEQAQKTGAQIAAALKFYVQNFGPLPRSMKEIYDIQVPEDANKEAGSWESSLLPAVVYDWVFDPGKSFWTKLGNGFASTFGQWELGYTWFGHSIRPRPEGAALGGALTSYASDLLGESNNTGASRTDIVASDLSDYDTERASAVEKPIISLTVHDSEDQLQIGGDKIELFMFALEDKCGSENVRHAISDMVYALRGEEYGYSDFRAALEQQCHQDLGGFFRQWLTQPGIPPDFRARYENAGGSKP
ncbi:MAG: hypothetical protein WAM80_06375 [Candidatus Acidiferrales bacterium]